MIVAPFARLKSARLTVFTVCADTGADCFTAKGPCQESSGVEVGEISKTSVFKRSIQIFNLSDPDGLLLIRSSFGEVVAAVFDAEELTPGSRWPAGQAVDRRSSPARQSLHAHARHLRCS